MSEILLKELSFAVVGAAMEVHKTLGPGYLEAVYQAALAQELALRGIAFQQFKRLPVSYKGGLVGEYVADLVIDDKIIVEQKAVSTLNTSHEAQEINYLATAGSVCRSCSTSVRRRFNRSGLPDELRWEPRIPPIARKRSKDSDSCNSCNSWQKGRSTCKRSASIPSPAWKATAGSTSF